MIAIKATYNKWFSMMGSGKLADQLRTSPSPQTSQLIHNLTIGLL